MDNDQKIDRSFCSQLARAADPPLRGTATEASTWLLVEAPAAWGRKALAESNLPADVKSHLLQWEAAAHGRRVQFIRRDVNVFDAPGNVAVFVALAGVQSPELYRIDLEDYAGLLKLDAERMHEGPLLPRTSRVAGPLFLTCTNGRRDACCAKWGRAMARAMAEAAGEAAWQTTHLGGHRFAPTQLVLPGGSQYGWLEPGEAPALVESHRSGRLYRLDRLRGRVAWARPAQAAAVFLREELGLYELAALDLADATQDGAVHRVRFRAGGEFYNVEITEEADNVLPTSCGGEPEAMARFVLT